MLILAIGQNKDVKHTDVYIMLISVQFQSYCSADLNYTSPISEFYAIVVAFQKILEMHLVENLDKL